MSRRFRTRLLLAGLLVFAGLLIYVGAPFCALPQAGREAHEVEPALRFERTTVDLGDCEPDSERSLTFPWRWMGPVPLSVIGVRADCGCLRHEGLADRLPIGARGTLQARVRVPRRQGPFRIALRIYASVPATEADAEAAVLRDRLSVVGFVGRPFRLVPAALRLGPHTAGRWLERSIELYGTRAFASESGGRIRARLVCFDADVEREGEPLGEVRVAPPHAGRDAICVLHLRFQVPVRTGRLRGALLLELDERLLARVPVELESVGPRPERRTPAGPPASRPERPRAPPSLVPPR